MINQILWLIFAHFLGDYALQSDWMAKMKHKDYYVLFAHSAIWTGVIAIALSFFGLLAIWKVFFLLIGHFLCDGWKCKMGEKYWIFDQLFHLFQLLIVILL